MILMRRVYHDPITGASLFDCSEEGDSCDGVLGGLTVWHSAAASAGKAFKKQTISRAKRSAAMPGWAACIEY
jgi:hypothetical protein